MPASRVMFRDALVGLVVAILFVCGARVGFGAGSLRLWIEGEDFTSATKGVKVVSGDYAKLGAKEAEDGLFFLARSQRDPEPNVRVSNSRYIMQTAGGRGVPTPFEAAAYEFDVPSAGEYYFWVRCDAPAGCNRYMNLWLDVPEAREPVHLLGFQHWGLWTWWPWGDVVNRGRAKGYSLAAGPHTLFLGDMDAGAMVDKILVTDDPDYVPDGLGDNYYNTTFESEEVIGAHNAQGNAKLIEPKATGWRASPEGSWAIREEGVAGNHYYVLREPGTDAASAATIPHSLIEGVKCRLFSADLEVFLAKTPGVQHEPDAVFLYGFQNPLNYGVVGFRDSTVEILRVQSGRSSVVAKADVGPISPGKHRVSIARTRTHLGVNLDGKRVLDASLPLEKSGAFGVGTHTVGVGFDNVRVVPSEDVGFVCDFAKDGAGCQDWVRLREGNSVPWTPGCDLKDGDVVLFDVPPWSGSEVTFSMADTWDGAASILFPYVAKDRFIETRLDAATSGTIELIRHVGPRTKRLAKTAVAVGDRRGGNVAVTCVRGLLSVSIDGRSVLEANEYDLVAGALGFAIGKSGTLPVKRIEATAKTVIVDTFPLLQGGGLMPDWKIVRGAWAVRPVMENDLGLRDGQLVAEGPGELAIGERSWRNYRIGISASFESGTELAVDGRVGREGAIEVVFGGQSVRIRRRVDKESIDLQSATFGEPLNGWHGIGVLFAEDKVCAEVDGKTLLETPMQPGSGPVGLRNLGQYGLFDDLRIDVLATDAGRDLGEDKTDPAVVDIARDLLK